MTDKEKLYQAYYQPDRLWTGGNAIKELHKITSMSKKISKPWLAKKKTVLPKDGLYRYLYRLGKQHGDQKR